MLDISHTQPVEFEFYHPQARQARVEIDAGASEVSSAHMTHAPDGSWRCRFDLPAGEHGFRFVADGETFGGASITLPSDARTHVFGCNMVRVADPEE